MLFFSKTWEELNEGTIRGMKSAYEKVKKSHEKLKIKSDIISLQKISLGTSF